MIINLVLFISLLSCVHGDRVQLKNSLLVVDASKFYQLPIDAPSNFISDKHQVPSSITDLIEFMSVRRFGNSFIAVLGGCSSEVVGQAMQNETNIYETILPLRPLIGSERVCYALPGFDQISYFALMDSSAIVSYNSNDSTIEAILPPRSGTKCSSRSNLQIDYNKRILYYMDCYPSSQTLNILNLDDKTSTGKQLLMSIDKFEIDFNNDEIFAISSSVLLKGKLDDSKAINFGVFKNVSRKILDFAVSPSNVYIITVGDNDIKVVSRSNADLTGLNINFTRPLALAYNAPSTSTRGTRASLAMVLFLMVLSLKR